MEYRVIRKDDELYHYGIRGMKWGVRRYQNKDGSLTAAGEKRYNKALETMNDSSSSKRAKNKARKTVEQLGPGRKKSGQEETVEEKRSRLLNSTNAKEIYENRHLLSTNELNERINRIDTEARLKSKIVEEHEKTGMDYVNEKMQSTKKTLDNVTNMYRSVDSAFSAVTSSSIGKTLAKKLGIETPKKEFDLNDFIKNINKKTTQEVMDANKRVTAEESLRKKAAEREQSSNSSSKNSDKTSDKKSSKDGSSSASSSSSSSTPKTEKTETWTGTVEGQGTSRYREKEGPIYDGEFTETTVSGLPSIYVDRGRSYMNDRYDW